MSEYLQEQKLESDLPSSNNPNGSQNIQRFTSKQFGATFSRVVKIVHLTATVETNPRTGNASIKTGVTRVKDTIIYGRICLYPNILGTYWTSIAEEEPFFDYFQVGTRPYTTVKFDDIYLDLLNSSYSSGQKVVIQLLFVEL